MLLTCCRCEINYSKVAQQEKSPIPTHLDPSVKFFLYEMFMFAWNIAEYSVRVC